MRKIPNVFVMLLFLSVLLFTCMTKNSRVEIQYGDSMLYSQRERDDAIELIMQEISAWSGCELHQITYAGDNASIDKLAYCNQITMNQPNAECIVFSSSFSTTKDSKLAGPFEPDSLYKDWMWYLARRNGGKWKIITYGY